MTSFTTSTLNYPQLANTPIKRVTAKRPPTDADHFNFILGDEWLDLNASPHNWWKLVNKTATTGKWIMLGAGGGTGTVTEFTIDTSTSPGTNPVLPDVGGNVTIVGRQVAAGTTPNAIQTNSIAANSYQIQIQRSQTSGSSTIALNGVCHFSSNGFAVDANGFVTLTGTLATTYSEDTGTATPSGNVLNIHGGTGIATTGSGNTVSIAVTGSGVVQTLSDDVGTSVTPSSGNIQLVGHVVNQSGNFSTTVAGSHLLNINPMSVARWIVDPLGFNGTHTTIASALTSATSGDTIFLMPGTYTENLIYKPGVSIVAWESNSLSAQVVIHGNGTYTGGTQINFSGINFTTNAGFAFTFSGSSAGKIWCDGCNFTTTDHTMISFTNSNASSQIIIDNSFIDIQTTGVALYSMSSPGGLFFALCTAANSGNTTTSSNNSAGTVQLFYNDFGIPLSTSGTGSIACFNNTLNTLAINTACLNLSGTGSSSAANSNFQSGSGSAISINAGHTLLAMQIQVQSSNTNAITGAGTLQAVYIAFYGTSSTINTTTVSTLPHYP